MITNKFDVPLPIAMWLASEHYKQRDGISATLLMKSPRYIIASLRNTSPEKFDEENQLTLTQKSKFDLDVQDLAAAKLGVAVHTAVEEALENQEQQVVAFKNLGIPLKALDSLDLHVEQRVSKEVNGISISGQFDFVVNGQLMDLKTTKTFSWNSPMMAKKYALQGSIYRWLNPELITKDTVQICFLFTDWIKHQTSKEDYPPAKIISKHFDLWSVAQTDVWVKNKVSEVLKYWDYPLMDIPCCTEEDLYPNPPVYKYYKTGYVEGKRSTKNFDTLTAATLYRQQQGGSGEIIEYKGNPYYCPFCEEDHT